MEHRVETVGHDVGERRQLEHIDDLELRALRHRPTVPLGQVVGHRHLVAGVDEVPGDDAADVAGASDDESLQRDLPATNGRAVIVLQGSAGRGTVILPVAMRRAVAR